MFMNMTKTVLFSTGLQKNLILVSALISVKTEILKITYGCLIFGGCLFWRPEPHIRLNRMGPCRVHLFSFFCTSAFVFPKFLVMSGS